MQNTPLSPKARRAQDASRARATSRKIEEIAPVWQIAALVLTGIVVLVLI